MHFAYLHKILPSMPSKIVLVSSVLLCFCAYLPPSCHLYKMSYILYFPTKVLVITQCILMCNVLFTPHGVWKGNILEGTARTENNKDKGAEGLPEWSGPGK